MARPRCLKHGPEYRATRISNGKVTNYCKACANESRARIREANRARKLYALAFAAYPERARCRKCNGTEKLIIEGGKPLLIWLRDLGWPPDYPLQVICTSCRFETWRAIARYQYAAIMSWKQRQR